MAKNCSFLGELALMFSLPFSVHQLNRGKQVAVPERLDSFLRGDPAHTTDCYLDALGYDFVPVSPNNLS